MFSHFQKLSPAFHDDYTSGRVISRQTSDIDAINELLETGFDGLITAVLTLFGTAVLLLVLDVKLGLVALLVLPVPLSAHAVVPARVGQGLSAYPRDRRRRHRALRRDDQRHARGAGLPARGPQPGDLRRRQRRLPSCERARIPPGRHVHAGHQADRQHHHRGGARLRRPPGLQRRGHRRGARGVPALSAAVLRADAGDLAVLQHVPVRVGGAGEAVRRARGGAVGPRAARANFDDGRSWCCAP